MENLCKVPKKCILKIYDLKGSTYNRTVIKKGGSQKRSSIFKDQDFLNHEDIIRTDMKL